MATTATKRIIGIRHRVKKTAKGEARPTQIFISGDKSVAYDLEDDDAELDFVLGRFPTSWRETTEADTLEGVPTHHVKWRKLKEGEEIESLPAHLLSKPKGSKAFLYADKIPKTHDGLKEGDRVAMILGGSGDRFAFALTNRGKKVGASVHRISAFVFKGKRPEDGKKDDDARILTEVFSASPGLFYQVRSRDEKLIRVRETLRARMDAMKARMGCEQRLRQRFIGEVFLCDEGEFPEGSIEDKFDSYKASDSILSALEQEEAQAAKDLVSACNELDVFKLVFEPVTGCGPMTSARIIAAVIDIRMFESKAKLKAFLGAHVLSDGRFPRRRSGEIANWSGEARQALYLLAEQWNKRPDSYWGKKLLEYKARLRAKHPEAEINPETGNKKYTKMHIHKMASWRTSTKFVEWLFTAWWDLENGKKPVSESPDGSGLAKPEAVAA